MTMLDKVYEPHAIEKKWYEIWENQGYFKPNGNGESFCMMLPPPNVTGSLHMGHGFGFTLMDVIIRYERMCGKKTLWQTGTDHAGIATQMVVEKQLIAQGQSKNSLGREAFIKKIWQWKQESGGNITRQLRRLGASMDWERERFTLDESLSYAVSEVFIRLYEEGLIYRGTKLVNWDPVLLTAISDLEVINEEEQGQLWHIRYPLIDQSGFITIATTRPETLLGDVAVAVHPEDERYQALIGKSVILPLCNRIIPIIADDTVMPEFGTGCVKITPAHDFNDYAMGLRHHLKPINIFTPQATLNENVPHIYQGLDRFVARKKIVEALKTENLIEKIEAHTLKIPRGEKSGAIIEPFLTPQWFLTMKPLAAPAIAAVAENKIRFIPDNWSKTYFQWMHNIEDWCISRQLWWGHRLPVWYDEEGHTYVGHNENDVRKRYQLANTLSLTQDEDVLDTWFSSALWPFSTLGWPQNTEDFKDFFPTQLLITGFDIIFFWVARMIMMSLKFTGEVPFENVYITGLIRDAEGHKMSKSKGNVLDPIDLIDGIDLESLLKKRTHGLMQSSQAEKIEKTTRKEFPTGIPSFGTDALRFTFCTLASYTREIRFDIQRLSGYRNFCNKLWNAARFVLMNTENQQLLPIKNSVHCSLADRWIVSVLQTTIQAVHTNLQQYRFDLMAQTLYDFTWNEFCDWYLELAKFTLNDPQEADEVKQNTRFTLLMVLETLLKLLHPIMPFITEEIWQRIAPLLEKKGPSIMLETYPESDTRKIDNIAIQNIDWIKKITVAVRTLRSENNIPPGKVITAYFAKGEDSDKQNSKEFFSLLKTLAKLDTITWLDRNQDLQNNVSTIVGTLEIVIQLDTLINKAEEIGRLQKEILKTEKELSQVESKLKNADFIEKAPINVVEKEKKRFTELTTLLKKLHDSLYQLT